MVHLITGYAGENHITSSDDGALNQAIFGQACFVLEGGSFDAEIIDNNTVRINAGEGVMYGRHFRIEPETFDDVTIANGQAGMQRYDIIVATYEKDTSTGIESVYLEVIKGTPRSSYPSFPSYQSGNIYLGSNICRFRLYDVFIDGVELKKITKRFSIQKSLYSLSNEIGNVNIKADKNAKDISDVNSNLKEHIIIINGNIPYTCNAGGVININPCKNVVIPTGYTAVAIVGFSLNSPYMTMINCIWANTNYGLYFRNDGNTEVSTNIGINVLCVKQ